MKRTLLPPDATCSASVYGLSTSTNPTRMVGCPFCPDLLEYKYLGAADNLRGRVVRGFFWCMRWWKP